MSKTAIELSRTVTTKVSWQERLFLLEHLTGKSIPSLIAGRVSMTDAEEKTFIELLSERENGKPLDLIIGKKRFLDFEISLEPGVFIPRPETEELLENMFSRIRIQPRLALDMCTGTGSIAIALARRFPDAKIIATDLSPAALSLASRNAFSTGVGDRIIFKKADLIDPDDSKKIEKKVDLLVSNPPYVPTGVIESLDREVRLYDPILALDGGNDGSNAVKRIIDLLPRLLTPEGFAALEIDPCLEEPLREYDTHERLILEEGVDIFGNLRFLYARCA